MLLTGTTGLEFRNWSAPEKALFISTLIACIVGGILTSLYYHTPDRYCYLSIGALGIATYTSILIYQCKKQSITLVEEAPKEKELFPGLQSHTEFLKKHLLEIGQEKKIEGVEYYQSGDDTLVFSLKTLPDCIFKLSKHYFDKTLRQEDTISTRYKNTLACKKVCLEEDLDDLLVPEVRLIHIDEYVLLVETKFIPAKVNETIITPELILAKSIDLEMGLPFAQLFFLILKTGLSDVVARNLMIVEREGKLKIALLDLQFFGKNSHQSIPDVLFQKPIHKEGGLFYWVHPGYLLVGLNLLGFGIKGTSFENNPNNCADTPFATISQKIQGLLPLFDGTYYNAITAKMKRVISKERNEALTNWLRTIPNGQATSPPPQLAA